MQLNPPIILQMTTSSMQVTIVTRWLQYGQVTVCWFMQLLELKAQIEDTSLQYPDYYHQKFHAYDGGNLDWEAAWEVEVADATLAMRIFKDDKLTPQLASHELRKSFLDATQVMLSFHMLVHFLHASLFLF